MKITPNISYLKTRRKRCLFACACVREIGHLLQRWPRLCLAIDIVELSTDKKCKDEKDAKLCTEIYNENLAVRINQLGGFEPAMMAVMALIGFTENGRWFIDASAASSVSNYAAAAHADSEFRPGQVALVKAYKRQRAFITDLVNPLMPKHIQRDNEQVKNAAQTIYDLRRWEDMPILADQLEEYGCTDDIILQHLRGPGPHVKGCWVLDMILGKR